MQAAQYAGAQEHRSEWLEVLLGQLQTDSQIPKGWTGAYRRDTSPMTKPLDERAPSLRCSL